MNFARFKYLMIGLVLFGLSTSLFTVCEKYYQRGTWYSGMTKLGLVTLFLGLSMLKISSGTYNPFLYFRF